MCWNGIMQNVKVTPKGAHGPVAARISMIFARKSPVAVVFRRGPSKWIQVIKWDTDTDTLQPDNGSTGKYMTAVQT
jgi:hypothetical protein